MKKILAVVLAVVMMCGVVLAQDAPAGNQAGAKSMNFTFGGLGVFGLAGTGPAGGLGVQYFLSSEAAVRLGLQVAIGSTSTPYNDPTGTNPGTDGSTSGTTLGLGADYLMYMGGQRVKPYMGAGFSFSLNSTTTKNAYANNAGAGTVVETSGGSMTLGLRGIAGAEFYLYNDVSLSAEYSLNLFSLTSNSDATTKFKGPGVADVTTKGGSSTNILGFGAGGATVHIYF